MQMIHESPILQEVFAERFEQGEHKATLKALYRILTTRFQVSLGYFEQKNLAFLDLETLDKLSDVALTAQTLVEFEETLNQLTKQNS
jgi:hypothetical protein